MTLDRSKSLTPQAIAENFHKKNVYTKLFGAWVSLIRERGQIVRVRNRCFLKWKRFAPLRSRMTLMKKKIKIWDDLTRTKKAFTAMCKLCFDLIGTHATTLKELRQRLFNRKVLTCAYALMNRDVNVVMLDCWRRLKKWWHARVQWRQSMWNFRYSWYYNRHLTIFKAWKGYVDMMKGRIADPISSDETKENDSVEGVSFKTSYNSLINPDIMTEYLGHVDATLKSSTPATQSDMKLYQMRKARIPQVATLHFIYRSISCLYRTGGVMTNEILQTNLQRNIDNFDYDGVAKSIADGAIIFPNHVRQISQTVGEQHVPMLALLLQGSPIYVADTISRQLLVNDLLNCCDPLKAILLQEHVNRWDNGHISRRETLTLEQFTPHLYSNIYGKFSSIYLMRVLVLLLVKKNLLDTVLTCQTLKLSRTVDEEVVEAKKRHRVERFSTICNSLNLLLFDEVESKNASYSAQVNAIVVPPLTWGADGEVRCKRNIDTWVQGLNIYSLLHAYKEMTGKFSAEAFALRQPLIERDNELIKNGFIRQARVEFLQLRRACMTEAEKLKEKEDILKKLKGKKKEKGKKKVKGKGKKKGKKGNSNNDEIEENLAPGSQDVADAADDDALDVSQSLDQDEKVLHESNAKDVLRELGFGHSFSGNKDDGSNEVIDENEYDDDDDDADYQNELNDDKDNFVNNDWEQYGIPGVTADTYKYEDHLQSDSDVKDEIFFQYRLKLSLTPKSVADEASCKDTIAPVTYKYQTVALLETYVPIVRRVVSPAMSDDTNEQRLKSYLLRESRKVKYRILKQFFTWCGILPIDTSSNNLPPQAKVDSLGGFGPWLILNGLRSKAMLKMYSEGSLLPTFWWNKSKVLDKVSLELGAINTMVNTIDERINAYNKEEDDIESHNEYLKGYYYTKKSEVILIAKKKSHKVVEETNYRQSKSNSHKNIEHEILSLEKNISDYKEVIKKCDFLLASNNNDGVIELLQNIELLSLDNEKFLCDDDANSSSSDQALRNSIYAFIEKINNSEIPHLIGRISHLKTTVNNHLNELKLYDKTCLRSTQWLQNMASERFNDMIDVNNIIVAGRDRISVLSGLRDNDMAARKLLAQYNDHLVHFVNELNRLENRKSLIMNYDTKVNDTVKVDEIETFLDEQAELIRIRRSKFGKLDAGIFYHDNESSDAAEYSNVVTSRSGLLADDDYSGTHLSADISLTDSLQPLNIVATIDISNLPVVKPPDLSMVESSVLEEKMITPRASSSTPYQSSPMRGTRAEQELLTEQLKKKEEEAEYEKAMNEMKDRTTNEYWLSIAPPKLTKVTKSNKKDNEKVENASDSHEFNHSLAINNALQVTGKNATTLYWDDAGKTVRKLNNRMKRRTINNTAPVKSKGRIDEFSDANVDQETDSLTHDEPLNEPTQIIRPLHFDQISNSAWQADLSCSIPSVSMKVADLKNNTIITNSSRSRQPKTAAVDTFLSVGKYYNSRIKHALSSIHEWDDDSSTLQPHSVKFDEEEVKDSDSIMSGITVDNAIKTDIDIDSYLQEDDEHINFIEALGTNLHEASGGNERNSPVVSERNTPVLSKRNSPVVSESNLENVVASSVVKKGVSFQDRLEFYQPLEIPLCPPPPITPADTDIHLDRESICDSLNSYNAKEGDNINDSDIETEKEYFDEAQSQVEGIEVLKDVQAAASEALVAPNALEKTPYQSSILGSTIEGKNERTQSPIPKTDAAFHPIVRPSDLPLIAESLGGSDDDSVGSVASTDLSIPGINISVSDKKKRKHRQKVSQHHPADMSPTLVVSSVSSPKSNNSKKHTFEAQDMDKNSSLLKPPSQVRDIKLRGIKDAEVVSKLGNFVTNELSKFNEERLKLIDEFVRAQINGDDMADETVELELDDEDVTPHTRIRLNPVTMTNITDGLLQRLDDIRDRPGPSDKMVRSDKASVQQALRSVKNRKLLLKELQKFDRKNISGVTSPKRNLQLLISGSGSGVDIPVEGLVKKRQLRKLDKTGSVTKESNMQRLEDIKIDEEMRAKKISINGRGFVPPLLDDYVASMVTSSAGASTNISNHFNDVLPNLSVVGSQLIMSDDNEDDRDIDSLNKSLFSINKLADIIMDDEDDEDLQQVYMAIFGSGNIVNDDEVKSLQQAVEFDDEIDDTDNVSYPTALFDGISEASNLRNNNLKDKDIVPSSPTTRETHQARLHLASRDATANNSISFRDYVTSRGGQVDNNGPSRSSTAATVQSTSTIDTADKEDDVSSRVATPYIIQSSFSPLRSKLLSAERPNTGVLPLSRGVSQPSLSKDSVNSNDVWYNIYDENDIDIELELRSMLNTSSSRSLKSRNSSSPTRGFTTKKPPKVLLPAMTNASVKFDSSAVNFNAIAIPSGGLKKRKNKGVSNRNTLRPLFTYDVDSRHSVDDLQRNFNIKGLKNKNKPKLSKNLLSYSTSELPTDSSLGVGGAVSNGADYEFKQKIAPPKVSIIKSTAKL